MPDLMRGFVFVLCQLLVLGFLFALILLRKPGIAARTVPMIVIAFSFGLSVGVTILAAGIEIGRRNLLDGTMSSSAIPSSTETARASPRELTRGVMLGKPVVIRFDREACQAFDLGSIECGSDYQGAYDAATNRWTITGVAHYDGVVHTYDRTDGGTTPGSLNLWGMLSRFGDDGVIFYFGEPVGTIRLANEPTAAPAVR